MHNKNFVKTGAVFFMLGGLISLFGAMLHKRTPPTALDFERLHDIATHGIWMPLHYIIAISGIFTLIGFIALYTYLKRDDNPWVRLATVFVVISSTFTLVLMAVDGFAIRLVTNDWVNALGTPQEQTLFYIAKSFEHLNVAIFSMFILMYFGITFLCYGIAILSGVDFPKFLGRMALLIGTIGFLAGTFQLLNTVTVASTIAFVAAWVLVSVWEFVMGMQLFKRAKNLLE